MEAVDGNGIVLVKGKVTKSGTSGGTEDKVTYTGNQTMTMQLARFDPGSSVPTATLRFNVLNPQKVSIQQAAYTEPGMADLNHHIVSPFSMIQYHTRFTPGK